MQMQKGNHVRQVFEIFETDSLEKLRIDLTIVAKTSFVLGRILFSDDDTDFVGLCRYYFLAVVEDQCPTQ